MKKKTMKRLGQGYIWFKWDQKAGTYTHVALATKPNLAAGNKLVPITMHRLGAWQKVRLWAEVLK